ncbi:hypothetical protein ANN_14079 [Periplaneta americana]|uniref:HTH psq-type domain-containing protein n=1 Tax=Periplaneta americana TaxID=6978 RepID=A0ABQ8SWR0_PERAM|nr:hypothetical protein ANN_14079 [Periplaneta americana]
MTKWVALFKHGRENVEDDPRSARPVTATSEEIVEQIHNIVLNDRRLKVRKISEVLRFSPEQEHYGSVPVHLAFAKLQELRFELFPNIPYSPDLAPSDFFLSSKLKTHLYGMKFSSYGEVIAATEGFFADLGESVYKEGIAALQHQWSNIEKWQDTFLATGTVLKKHGDGRRTSDEMVANVQAAYERSTRKSLRRASRELLVPKSTLQRIVHKRLKLYAYKLQLMQRLEPDNKSKRVEFANMLDRLCADPDFMSKIFFSDEATFHVSDKQQVIGPFFFAEKTECGTTYLDMLEQFFFPQIEHLQPNIAWHPDLTPFDFFLWGYVKDKMYATPVRGLRDLRERIIEAIESIPEDMLQRAWQEIVHRLDIVTVTAGAHVHICDVRFELTTSVPRERAYRAGFMKHEGRRDEGKGKGPRDEGECTRNCSMRMSKPEQASQSSTRVCVRICVSIRRPEFECSGPQLEGPEFECSGPQLEGPEFEYSELSLKVCGSRYCELE